MSVVIVGGHDRMVAQYKKICKSYKCKVYYLPIQYLTRWCAAHWMRSTENIPMWFAATPAAETH